MNTTILDGGMGRELAARGAPFRQPEWSALALWEAPHAVQTIHEDFIHAGAHIITANSYALVPFHIGQARFAQQAQQLAQLSGELAQQAIHRTAQSGIRVAGSLPPLFGSYRPDLFIAEQAAQIAQPLIAGLAPLVDIWLLETQGSIIEACTLLDCLPNDGKPIWLSFTPEEQTPPDAPKIRSGESVAQAVIAVAKHNVDAVLFNCASPAAIHAAIVAARNALQLMQTNIALGGYANAFVDTGEKKAANQHIHTIRDDLNPQQYLAETTKWHQHGASIIGGCCGITPAHIQALAKHYQNH